MTRSTRRLLCAGLLALPLLCSSLKAAPETLLWYRQPARNWNEALPVGNGHMGAMIFGGTAEERIQFNEDTLWLGGPHDYAPDNALEVLPKLRQLIREGKTKEADVLGKARFLGIPARQKPFQPFGDLHLSLPGHEAATDYRRELDLSTGTARVSYKLNGVHYTREVFASYPDRAIIVRLTASKPGSLSLLVGLDSPHADSQTHASAEGSLKLSGRLPNEGLRFCSFVDVRTEGGRTQAKEHSIEVTQADTVTLVLVAATSLKSWKDVSDDAVAKASALLATCSTRTFTDLRERQLSDHQALFGKSLLDLAPEETQQNEQPTDERVQRQRKAKGSAPAGLASLYFNYGRYLLMGSSRPGSQPANLQGVWNELVNPPWESKYTTNINAEMNYWPAEVTNLAECHLPLFALIDEVMESGARTAKKMYGARGWVLHHNTDMWRGTAPVNNIDGIWPTGGAWLCHHLWEHYQYSGDQAFLKRAWPALEGATRFFLDTLVDDASGKYLLTSPSFSPEMSHPGGTLTEGPAMDMQLVRALFQATLEAGKILGSEQSFLQETAAALARLPGDRIGRHGQLQEWLEDWDKPNNGHRHMSPLWALYPGNDITPSRPEVFAAAKVLLEWRGDGSTGWSYAWRIPLWARVGDGAMAYRQFSELLARKTLPNLFDLCGPFQIDGNFGATGGMAEMLLQSHELGADGVRLIRLLPALPKEWPSGHIKGLRARGGFTLDISWSAGHVTHVVIHSKLGTPCDLLVNGETQRLEIPAAQERTLQFQH